ncbi:cytochrome b5 domain-containing protein [Micropruina sp.]|uniref:cytochrome b5 domain-containing protein n=1 Tax=Micropruina sp. TaxID=2737536 RepID=UPI0039E478E0
MFDVFGLPLHPLVVHAVVVLLPLSAIGLIACVFVARWRRSFAGLSVLGLVAGAISAFVAAASGNALAEQVGVPATHQALGQVLPWLAAATVVLAAVWYFMQRGQQQQAPLTRGIGVLAAVVAAASVTLTVLVGHSGASAVWGGTSAAATTPAAATTSATASGSTSAEASYTLDQVKQHNQATDCWAAIDDSVYNLTDWVNQHPGGADHIVAICGTDATQAFEAQHSGDQRPQTLLAGFRIGELAS